MPYEGNEAVAAAADRGWPVRSGLVELPELEPALEVRCLAQPPWPMCCAPSSVPALATRGHASRSAR